MATPVLADNAQRSRWNGIIAEQSTVTEVSQQANALETPAILPDCTHTPTPTATRPPNGAPLDPQLPVLLTKIAGPQVYDYPVGSGEMYTAYMYSLQADPYAPPSVRMWVNMAALEYVADWPGWQARATYVDLPVQVLPDGRKDFSLVFRGVWDLPTWTQYEIGTQPMISNTIWSVAPAPRALPSTGYRMYLPLVSR
jgi:hypothetical protein